MLPESFAAYTLFSDNGLAVIAKSLGLSKSSNVASMGVISCLWMVSDSKLGASTCTLYSISTKGLNEDGYPKASIGKRKAKWMG